MKIEKYLVIMKHGKALGFRGGDNMDTTYADWFDIDSLYVEFYEPYLRDFITPAEKALPNGHYFRNELIGAKVVEVEKQTTIVIKEIQFDEQLKLWAIAHGIELRKRADHENKKIICQSDELTQLFLDYSSTEKPISYNDGQFCGGYESYVFVLKEHPDKRILFSLEDSNLTEAIIWTLYKHYENYPV